MCGDVKRGYLLLRNRLRLICLADVRTVDGIRRDP